MYPSIRNRPPATEVSQAPKGKLKRVPPTVVALGLTSFFSDISSEMVAAVLPLFLTFQLGFTPTQFGLFDGAFQAANGLFRIAGGAFADRRQRFKETAVAGYSTSIFSRLGLLAFGSAWPPAVGFLLADRVGKGIRTSPRDALISFSSDQGTLGRNFGVHRAMDTAGALLGPLIAFAILSSAPGAFDAVFVPSALAGAVGLACIVFGVRNPKLIGRSADAVGRRVKALGLKELLAERRFRRIVIIGGLLAAVTVSDPFLYLVLQRNADIETRYFPLFFAGTAVAYLLLAVPFGKLADRIGFRWVFLSGYVMLASVYVILWRAALDPLGVIVILALLGTFYAATDGVLMAMASASTPGHLRTTALAVVTTVIALGRLVASVVFGLSWSNYGQGTTLAWFTVAVLCVVVVAPFALGRSPRPVEEAA